MLTLTTADISHVGHYHVNPNEQNALLAQIRTVIKIDSTKTMTGALFFLMYYVSYSVFVFASIMRALLFLTPYCISLITSSPASSSSLIICVLTFIYFTALLKYDKLSSFCVFNWSIIC